MRLLFDNLIFKGVSPKLKRVSFYAVFVFLIAVFMTAGCAKQDVVKKDEGIVPAPVAKQVDQSKSNATPPKQAVTAPVSQVIRYELHYGRQV